MVVTHFFPPAIQLPDIPAGEYGAHCLLSEALELRRLPVAEIAAEREIIIEAREALNDVLARIDLHNERAGTAPLPLEMTHVQ